ncbi:MAG: PLDc N-terminal domain-containing protein, partial [Clostridia bacterium]|nr:PLDc N-terminal domain-containing protein [Clostridia bacterium]
MKKDTKKPRKKWIGSLLRMRFSIILLLVLQLAVIIYILFSGSTVSEVIRSALTVVSFFVCLHIVSKRDKGAYKLTWVFTILLFPLFGGMVYLFFRFQSQTKRFSKRISSIQDKARPFLSLSGSGYAEACSAAREQTSQIRYLEDFAGFPIYTGTKTEYLTPGEKKLEVLLEELRAAEKYIFLEYFIVEEGLMWDSILEVLEERVSAGVKVRLI